MHPDAIKYIDKLKLEPHPEGGYFKEIYRSGEIILPEGLPSRYKRHRNISTSIYFLLEGSQVSKFHKLKSDEIWHFYDGCSAKIYIIDNSGNFSEFTIGKNIKTGEHLQVVINNGQWFAAELTDKDSFCLVGCTVSPGFDFDDFELAKRKELLMICPEFKALIEKFTN